MNSPLTKTVAAVALAAGLALAAAPTHAAPLPLDDAPAIDVSSTGSAVTDYFGSAVGTDFAGSAENMAKALPMLPCILLSLSGIQTCDLTAPR